MNQENKTAAPSNGEPVAWRIDPGAGSACDRFQSVEPYGWQYAEVSARGGSITPLYAAPQPSPTAVVLDEQAAFEASFKAWTGQSISFDKVTDGEGDERYADEWLQGAWIGWQARAASPQPVAQPVEQTMGSWETSSISNELWQLADQCGYEQFRDAVTTHIKQAYQNGWTDRGKGVSSVTYGDQK